MRVCGPTRDVLPYTCAGACTASIVFPWHARLGGRAASARNDRRRHDPASDDEDLLRLRLTLVRSQYRAYCRVPTFIAGRYDVVGGQPYETLEQIVRKVATQGDTDVST